MTLLIAPEALATRGEAARGPLAALARSLRIELQPLLDTGWDIPAAKALLSRDGGRCPRDATPLEFDPYSPHAHRCPKCSEVYRGERHDRWWTMSYQLWLAERSVHAATLFALNGEPELAHVAARILEEYTDRYLEYPNRDNVLGPTRPFFSTYLESIWLLQLCVATDLLEASGGNATLGGVVRDRIVEPSLRLIVSYDEGGSNRQVWNNAALLAGNQLLGRSAEIEHAVFGRSGVVAHLGGGLLSDGTWFEGENYHLFAHRGLWYCVTLVERIGLQIPVDAARRFNEGFAAPLRTALPDFTFPARRDSQYGISLRQWRFAEACELGLARQQDRRLLGALWELYERPIARGNTGRWRSTAEVERNEPASSLSRADLGWRSLLLAPATLPPLAPASPSSALLEGQGIAVLRRDDGRVYVALDYGHSGGGHGHPDRLNLLLSVGEERWLDDPGTGSYVDPSLHWYRSTLAHNAPLVNGRSQLRAHGVLRAFDERGGVGWVHAEVSFDGIAPGVQVARAVVVMPDYLVDRITWESAEEVEFTLPLHSDAITEGLGEWRDASLAGGGGAEDGFSFLRDTSRADARGNAMVCLTRATDTRPHAWVVTSGAAEWWRARAPGPPGRGERVMHLVRLRGQSGSVTSVWSWARGVVDVSAHEGMLRVMLERGAWHDHSPSGSGWVVTMYATGGRSSIALSGKGPAVPAEPLSAAPRTPGDAVPAGAPVPAARRLPLSFHLGRTAYRMSEDTWDEAGRPKADVTLSVCDGELVIDVDVRKSPVIFRLVEDPDPALDNEHPDIHSDGVQVHIAAPGWKEPLAWLAVPEAGGRVRVRTVGGSGTETPLRAVWHATAAGYAMRLSIPVMRLGSGGDVPIALDLLINDMGPGRQRRRGQLALSGGEGEYVYLQGDRQPRGRLLSFVIPSA